MLAKFRSTCGRCGHVIQKDEEIYYDREAKKAYHPDCQDSGTETAEDIAVRLGWLKHDELLALLRSRVRDV